MGPIYSLEVELRKLCENPKENGDAIYIKLKELVGRLLARNTSRMGPDVDRWTLDHEIAADITTRIVAGTLKPIHNWSGYITKIMPRMIKANAEINGAHIIDTYRKGIDPKAIYDMCHAGSISMISKENERVLISSIEGLPSEINKWFNKNLRGIDKDSKIFDNLKISILISLITDKITLFRLPKIYENHVTLYLNKLKMYISKSILEGSGKSPYDLIAKIAEYEEKEDFFGD